MTSTTATHTPALAARGTEATPSLYVIWPTGRPQSIAPLYVPHTSPRKQKVPFREAPVEISCSAPLPRVAAVRAHCAEALRHCAVRLSSPKLFNSEPSTVNSFDVHPSHLPRRTTPHPPPRPPARPRRNRLDEHGHRGYHDGRPPSGQRPGHRRDQHQL